MSIPGLPPRLGCSLGLARTLCREAFLICMALFLQTKALTRFFLQTCRFPCVSFPAFCFRTCVLHLLPFRADSASDRLGLDPPVRGKA